MKALPSTSPYLIRAIYDWCCDASQTPYLSVRVSESSSVPMEHAKDGEIVLNIGVGATRDLRIENDGITFSARFNAVPREIYVSIKDVKGIFSLANLDKYWHLIYRTAQSRRAQILRKRNWSIQLVFRRRKG